MVMEVWVLLNSHNRPPVNRESPHHATLKQLEQEQSTEAAIPNSRSSQQSGGVSCGRRWHFRKSGYSTGRFKLKANS